MKIKYLTFVFLLIILSFAFYWFQWRPAQIRKECSWVEKHQQYVAAVPETNGWPNCISKEGATQEEYFEYLKCQGGQPREEIPEKSWWEEATDVEYKSCLRSRGIDR